MTSSALMLLSLLTHNNNNIMKHMFDVKTLEKRKLMHLNKSYYEYKRNKMNENRACVLFNTHKKYNLNNYNFAKS